MINWNEYIVSVPKNVKALNLGCGQSAIKTPSVLNLDKYKMKGVDVVWDVNNLPLPFKDSEFDIIYCGHILIYSKDFFTLMRDIWRIAKPNALVIVNEPYWSSKDAFTDRAIVKGFTEYSFMYFDNNNELNQYAGEARFTVEKIEHTYTKFGGYLPFKSFLRNVLVNIVSTIYFELRVVKGK